MCKDYISEKFWAKAINYHVVPVVMGPPREDYELVAPPNSFIHVDDYDSVESLAEYLKKLDADDKLYGEYLRWMSTTEAFGEKFNKTLHIKKQAASTPNGVCALCEKLNHDEPPSTVMKLDEWWYGEGYSASSDRFSICSSDSGASGYPLRWVVTLVYNGIVLFLGLLFIKIVFPLLKNRKSKLILLQ